MRKILILILLISTVYTASSQSEKGYGFKSGISLPFVTVDYNAHPSSAYTVNIETQNKIGADVGIFADVFKMKRIMLSSELYYCETSVNLIYTESDNSGNPVTRFTSDYKINYLTYGLIARYDFGKDIFLPYAYTGLRFSFYVRDDFSNSSQEIPNGMLTQITDNLKRIVPSVAFGLGAEIKASGKFAVLGEISFSPGIFRTYDFSETSAKTNSLSFKTGCRIFY